MSSETENAKDIIIKWNKFYQASYIQWNCEQSGKAENEANVGVRVIKISQGGWPGSEASGCPTRSEYQHLRLWQVFCLIRKSRLLYLWCILWFHHCLKHLIGELPIVGTHVLCRLMRYRHLWYQHPSKALVGWGRFWNPTNAIQPLGHLGCRAASTWSRMTEKLLPALWLQSCSTFVEHLWGTSTCAILAKEEGIQGCRDT